MSPFASNALETLIDKLHDLLSDRQRRTQAFLIRFNAALRERLLPAPEHPHNGDECLYPNRIGNFSKGLPHDDTGEVDSEAYETLIHALTTGDPADFEKIPLGAIANSLTLKRDLHLI